MTERFVIVGASLAGATAAMTLRDEDFKGEIVLIGAEPDHPYERPPLSKAYLRDEQPFAKAHVYPPDDYAKRKIDLRLGTRVTRIDPKAHTIEVGAGENLEYTKLLLTTGSRNRRLKVPGVELTGVLALRSRRDCDRIKREGQTGARAVVVGMGFIGAEVAASLRQQGVAVTALEMGDTPLSKAVGADIGSLFTSIHRERGVDLRFGAKVVEFVGKDRVQEVLTSDGVRIPCDFAVIGIGVEPRTELAVAAGLMVENGVVVDAHGRTSATDVFAAGDVANFLHPIPNERFRVEHYEHGWRHAAAVAKVMAGGDAPYKDVPYFWTDQYEFELEYWGFPLKHDDVVIRGDLERRDFVAFYRKDGVLVGAAGMNRKEELKAVSKLIAARANIEPAKLRDAKTDLAKLDK